QVQKLEQELSPAPLKQNGLRLIDQNYAGDIEKVTDVSNDPLEPVANLARVIPFTASGKRAH
ncbi:MAG: hypothetical protein VW447_11785, partial [Limnobacter sp.]